jgi:hypothetical protein
MTRNARPGPAAGRPGSWQQVPFPGRKGEIVGSVAETSAGDVWAFTGDQFGSTSRALRWNGSSWASVASFKGSISGAAVISPSDAWIFGAPDTVRAPFSARHWNGHTWAVVPSGHGLIDGSALSASSVWAIGSGGREDEGGPTVVLHYNGHAWSRVASRGSSDPAQVVPDGIGGLWIPVPGTGGQAAQVLHYSGGHLSAAPLPGGGGTKLLVQAIANVPGTGISYGAGFTHKKNNAGESLRAVVLVSG